jgi:hypothetical protein
VCATSAKELFVVKGPKIRKLAPYTSQRDTVGLRETTEATALTATNMVQ